MSGALVEQTEPGAKDGLVDRFVERTAADQGQLESLQTSRARLQGAQEALGYVEHRPPEAGAQVRILPGAPPKAQVIAPDATSETPTKVDLDHTLPTRVTSLTIGTKG